MSLENVETEWPRTELRPLEPRGLAKFRLSALDRGVWTLMQGRIPVALIRRSQTGHSLRTAADEWEAAIRRHGRGGWRLELARTDEPQTVNYYVPRSLLHARRVEVPSNGRVFRLRTPFMRDVAAHRGSPRRH